MGRALIHMWCMVQDCKPLRLTGRNGTHFDFVGVAAIAKGTVAAEASLVPPDAVGSGLFQSVKLSSLAPSLSLRFTLAVYGRCREIIVIPEPKLLAGAYASCLQAPDTPAMFCRLHEKDSNTMFAHV